MDAKTVEKMFTRGDGTYLFARWGRPIVPVVIGVDDATLSVMKGAIEAVVALADHSMAETDPELGVNLMMFFFRDWDELLETPDLDRLVPDLAPLVTRLKLADANQYRLFRFEPDGSVKAAFIFVRMDSEMSKIPAEDIALTQAAQTILLWSDVAFMDTGPLGRMGKQVVLRPDIAAIIRAGYDQVMPSVANDPSHSMRLAARAARDLSV